MAAVRQVLETWAHWEQHADTQLGGAGDAQKLERTMAALVKTKLGRGVRFHLPHRPYVYRRATASLVGAHTPMRLQEVPGCDSQRKILSNSWERVTSPKEL